MIKKLKTKTLSIFVFPNLVIQMVGFAVMSVVPAFYAKHTTLSLAVVGTVLAVSRLFDAVTDPLLGYLSDRTKTRFGKRKPWIAFSAVLGVFAIYFYLQPPADAGLMYFVVFSFLFYLSWTCFVVPYGAWAIELGRDHSERSRIFLAYGIAAAVGTMVFLSVPLMPFMDTTSFDSEAMSVVAWVGIILLPLSIFFALKFVPEGEVLKADEPKLKDAWLGLVKNRLLARFIAIYSLGGFASGIKVALMFIFIDAYLAIGNLYANIMIFFAIFQFVGMPFWGKMMLKFGKRRSWLVSMSSNAVLALALIFVPIGEAAFIPMVIIFSIRGFMGAIDHMVPHAILGDVIDYDIYKTKENRAASYYSLMALLVKGFGALGSGLSFILLGLFGYSVKLGDVNDVWADFGMLFIVAGVTTLLYIIAVAALWSFPLNESNHAAILKRLRRRQGKNDDK